MRLDEETMRQMEIDGAVDEEDEIAKAEAEYNRSR
ncbi:hypothetical protein LCGC14_0774080 [marine sediment metagenome]|uniref:Uncharacterized protein n=1 Tax=marine sediment metagenome TaxID=412755 RepID=A0A0F9PXM3_9ZZZZ